MDIYNRGCKIYTSPMSKYTVEVLGDYPGVREYTARHVIGSAGIYVESLPAHTELTPYRFREISGSRGLQRGFVLDASLELLNDLVWISPQIDPNTMKQMILKAAAANPAGPNLDPSQFSRFLVTHGHMRSERGLKLLLPGEDREWLCRLHPPAATPGLYSSTRYLLTP